MIAWVRTAWMSPSFPSSINRFTATVSAVYRWFCATIRVTPARSAASSISRQSRQVVCHRFLDDHMLARSGGGKRLRPVLGVSAADIDGNRGRCLGASPRSPCRDGIDARFPSRTPGPPARRCRTRRRAAPGPDGPSTRSCGSGQFARCQSIRLVTVWTWFLYSGHRGSSTLPRAGCGVSPSTEARLLRG